MVVSVGIYASVEFKENRTDTIANYGNEKYEKVAQVSGVYINTKSGVKNNFAGEGLYKGINTCGVYYFKIPGTSNYYPVHKNTDSTFKGVDVSSYNSYAQYGEWRYFFFY